ncbi:MAG TPA: Hsp70 family protein [Acidimicrobiales bacterium]|nr:Hsp70 family protein [Acidimicrobiales bacterium]
MTYTVGIDVGTTFTAAATHRDGRTEVITLGDRGDVIPSVAYLRDDDVLLIGHAAERRAVFDATRVARGFKRRIGDHVPIVLGDRPFRAETLTAAIVRWVVELVSTREGGPPSRIALTFPASWGDHRCDRVRSAAAEAGVDDPELLSEPVAAAVHYASRHDLPVGATVGIYDLGGGTFDATIIRREGDGFTLVGRPQGDDHLGGVDLDALVWDHVVGVVGQEALEPEDGGSRPYLRALAQVRAAVVDAKEALSYDTQAVVPVTLPGLMAEVRITRREFEEMAGPALLRTVEVLGHTCRAAGVDPSELHAVLLVGGSSRIPLIAQLIGHELGARVAADAHPKSATCLGAARGATPRRRPSVTATAMAAMAAVAGLASRMPGTDDPAPAEIEAAPGRPGGGTGTPTAESSAAPTTARKTDAGTQRPTPRGTIDGHGAGAVGAAAAAGAAATELRRPTARPGPGDRYPGAAAAGAPAGAAATKSGRPAAGGRPGGRGVGAGEDADAGGAGDEATVAMPGEHQGKVVVPGPVEVPVGTFGGDETVVMKVTAVEDSDATPVVPLPVRVPPPPPGPAPGPSRTPGGAAPPPPGGPAHRARPSGAGGPDRSRRPRRTKPLLAAVGLMALAAGVVLGAMQVRADPEDEVARSTTTIEAPATTSTTSAPATTTEPTTTPTETVPPAVTATTEAPPETTASTTATTTSTTETPPTTPTPTETQPPGPGEPCDPDDGDPDCTTDSGEGTSRIVEGWNDCVVDTGEAGGLCSDLDGDGYAGYPDSG